MSDLSVLVVQMGARRAYELALMLEERGVLAALQTSTAWTESVGPSLIYRKLSRVSDGVVDRRTVRGIPACKVRTTLWPEAAGAALKVLRMNSLLRYQVEDYLLGASAIKKGLNHANVVLNTTGNGGPFLNWAKNQGALIASDIVITPLVEEILAEERMRWPQWENHRVVTGSVERYRVIIEKLIKRSDLLLSPSAAVDEGLSQISGFEAKKVARVAYGLNTTVKKPGSPVPRRILFAGHAGLRKGLPYLAEAARLLRPKGYEIRVAGYVEPNIRLLPECVDLNFLGHLSGDRLEVEFKTADVFCLPSLAEGMARVSLEAMAHGLPSVVTRSAGSPITSSREGYIVPERSGIAISESIQMICEDRDLRQQMSDAARQTVLNHSLDIVGARLHSVLLAMLDKGG